MLRSMMLAAAVVVAVAPVLAQTPSAPPAFTPRDETPEMWPAGEGRDDTFYMCTACHASGIIIRLGQTREGWNELIDQMVARHNMAPVDDDMRKVLVEYLAGAFPPRAPAAQGGWRNPFAP